MAAYGKISFKNEIIQKWIYGSLTSYDEFSPGELEFLSYVHPRPYFERGILGGLGGGWFTMHKDWHTENSHSFHRQPRETGLSEMEATCSQKDGAWDQLGFPQQKARQTRKLSSPGPECSLQKGMSSWNLPNTPWRALGSTILALGPMTKPGSPANAHQHADPLPGLRTDTKPPCSPAQTSNEPPLLPNAQTSPVYILLSSQT